MCDWAGPIPEEEQANIVRNLSNQTKLDPEQELRRRIRLYPDEELFIREREKRFRQAETTPVNWEEFFHALDGGLEARARSAERVNSARGNHLQTRCSCPRLTLSTEELRCDA